MGGRSPACRTASYSLATGGDDQAAHQRRPRSDTDLGRRGSVEVTPASRRSRSSSPASTAAEHGHDTAAPAAGPRPGRRRRRRPGGRAVRLHRHLPADAFVPTSASPAAITGIRGRYSVPCTGGPVLLTAWKLNVPLGACTPTGSWAATLVTNTECAARRAGARSPRSSPAPPSMGDVTTDTGCADDDFPLWLWLNGHRTDRRPAEPAQRAATASASPVLPEGTHILGAEGPADAGHRRGHRDRSTQDVDVACPGAPRATGGPTTSDPSPDRHAGPDRHAHRPSPRRRRAPRRRRRSPAGSPS